MDSLVVESEPSGADVTIRRRDREFTEQETEQNTVDGTGAIVGMTPSSFRLKREGTYKVVLSKTGYQSVESVVLHEVAGGGAAGMAGNVLLGGVIGAVVDSNTGAMLNLSPNPLRVVMSPIGEASGPANEAPTEPGTDSSDDSNEADDSGDGAEGGFSSDNAGTKTDPSDHEADAELLLDKTDADSSVDDADAGASNKQAGTNSS